MHDSEGEDSSSAGRISLMLQWASKSPTRTKYTFIFLHPLLMFEWHICFYTIIMKVSREPIYVVIELRGINNSAANSMRQFETNYLKNSNDLGLKKEV